MFINDNLIPAEKPGRIISLVPSITELLFDLGLDDSIAGITKFCTHPADRVKNKTIIGGTKNIHAEKIHALKPDLVIANKEENIREQVMELADHYPVWLTDVATPEDNYNMITQIGSITHTSSKAEAINREISSNFEKLNSGKHQPRKVVYLIWKDPYMTIGGDTFISQMLSQAGYANVFAGSVRYPEISESQIAESDADLIFLSSEPFPFREKHMNELSGICPDKKVLLVDGSMFSWYGSRMMAAAQYFQELYAITVHSGVQKTF